MYDDFVDMLWRHHKFGLVLGVISMHFIGVFSNGQGTEWRYVFWLLKFLIFLRVLDFPDIFLELTLYAGPKPTYDEEMRDSFDRLDSEKRTHS